MYAILVTWSEPEEGAVVYGPYPDEDTAADTIASVQLDFMNSGVLPDDVEIAVKRLHSAVGND